MKIKRNLLLIPLLLVLMIPFVGTISEDDPLQSKEFVEDYSMRGQTYRHWFNESSGEYWYKSDRLVHKLDIIENTDWVTIDEYPYRFIIRSTDGTTRFFETPKEMSDYISLIDNSSIWAVGYESFGGVIGFYLNFADQDWGHAQYVYWPRLKNGQISAYNQPLYAIYPHLYVRINETWYDQILNDRSLYGIDSNPRNALSFFNDSDEFGIYFTTYNINILSSNWDMVHGFKYNKTNAIYYMITQLRCNDRSFDDIGMAYEITSTPQSDGTPYQPEYFGLINETDAVIVNISQAWNAGTYLKDYYSTIVVVSKNGESFRFTFDDMEEAGFTEKYLNLHNQLMPDGRIRKVLRAGMYGFGSYSQGDWIEIDPIFSEEQEDDALDGFVRRSVTSYTGYNGDIVMHVGIQDLTTDRLYKGIITWDSGITEEITSTSDATFKIWVRVVYLEVDEYVSFALYDKGDADEYWSESELVISPYACYIQELYYEDTDFHSFYGEGGTEATVSDDTTGLLIDAWVTHHNGDPATRQYIPMLLNEGDGQDDDVSERDTCIFEESSNTTFGPTLAFTYELAAEEEEGEIVTVEEHDPIIQKPPTWWAIEFAWLIWVLIWGGMGILLLGAVLYYFFKELISAFN